MEVVIQVGLNALIIGAIYALVAAGFNLIYATARFYDVGLGALSLAAAYVVLYTSKILSLPLSIAIPLGIVFGGASGALVQYVVYRPLRARKASGTVLLVASIGVLTVVQALLAILFGSQFQTLSVAPVGTRIFSIFGGAITQVQVIILATAVCIMLALTSVLRFTLFGKAIRAIADDEEVARIVGINSTLLIGVVFFIGTAIGAIAAISTGFDTGILPTMGVTLLLGGIIASILGGIGNTVGGFFGAFLLAAIENAGVWFVGGEWRNTIAFLVLILILLLRPRGLLVR